MPILQTTPQFLVEISTDGDINKALQNNFESFRIINSTRLPWPIFQLICTPDNQTIIEKNIYGKSDITVKITYTAESGEMIGEPLNYVLLYMESNLDLAPKAEDSGIEENIKDPQRRKVAFTCLAKPAFQTMSQYVNKLWEEETTITPYDAVLELLDLKGIEINDKCIFPIGMNEGRMQQLIVPPMTIKSAVDYIHEKFGIFQGPLFRYANYAGQFCMWDLKQKYDSKKKNPWTTYHKIPSSFKDEDTMNELIQTTIIEDTHFMTYDLVQTLHYANANILNYGYDNIYLFHPHEDIIFHVKKNVDEIVEEQGIWDSNPEMKYHPDMKFRKVFYNDMKGFETGSGYSGEYDISNLTSEMASNFQDSSSIRFTLYRNIKLHLCQKVGEVMYLQPYSEHEQFPSSSYEGGYLISDSDIIFSKNTDKPSDNLTCIATLTGYRTSQSKD